MVAVTKEKFKLKYRNTWQNLLFLQWKDIYHGP